MCQRAWHISHFFASFSETFAAVATFFDGGGAFPVALRAEVNF